MYSEWKPQLSHSLEINKSPNKDYFAKNRLEGRWFMSEKFDGIRAIWTGNKLITRALREFTWVPQWFLDSLPRGFPLDGELIVPGKEFGYFSSITIQKECEKAHQKWNGIVYLVFDTPQKDITFRERRYLILEKLTILDNNQIKPVLFTYLDDIQKEFDVVNAEFNKIVGRGGEGVMLIEAESLYQSGKRSRKSLKYKKCHEGEAKVIDYCEGTGKYKGSLGKIKCKLNNGKTFFCGTGFNDEQRSCYHFRDSKCYKVDKPKKGVSIPVIGDTITYSCMEIINKTQIPRMSVYKGIRTDLS